MSYKQRDRKKFLFESKPFLGVFVTKICFRGTHGGGVSHFKLNCHPKAGRTSEFTKLLCFQKKHLRYLTILRWVYNTERNRWTIAKVSGTQPQAREGKAHSTVFSKRQPFCLLERSSSLRILQAGHVAVRNGSDVSRAFETSKLQAGFCRRRLAASYCKNFRD